MTSAHPSRLETPNTPEPASKKMPSPDAFLVRLPPKAVPVAMEAARLAFPRGKIQIVADLAAIKADHGSRSLVVVGEPDLAAALIAQPGRQPGSAVVVMSDRACSVAETVPSEEWDAPLLARVFRSAVREQELADENERLRGDLKTVSRRISHDLRTPLGCIFTTSDVLKEMVAGQQDNSATEMVVIIKESAVEISQVVDRVAFVLKATAEPLPPTEVNLEGIVAGVLRQLDPEFKKTGTKIVLPKTWPEAKGVASWLHVVWLNLLRNALQKGGPSGRIEIAWKTADEGFRFSVMDQGAGVTDSELAGLFSPFEQMHELHTHGLGLSFVQRLVSLQGGRCGYEKLPDGRPCFYFTLPAADRP